MVLMNKINKNNKVPQPNARLVAAELLEEIYVGKAYANIALQKTINRLQLVPVERRFLTELVYGTVKFTNTLDWILGQFVSRPLNKIPSMIVNILRLAVYQIFYMDKVPVSAACNEAVNLTKKYSHAGTVKFVNGVLRNIIRGKEKIVYPDLATQPVQHIALKYSHPEWLVKVWLKQLGLEATIELCMANNVVPHLSIRTNTLKITRPELLKVLEAEGMQVQASAITADGIVVLEMKNSFAQSESFKSGLWQVQDESSMLVADILQPRPEKLVIDLCSAPGGKSTHFAQKMLNKGKVLSFDVYEHKLALIKENALRLGIDIIEIKKQDASILQEGLVASADYVLVDAPCSGLGVLRRRADARWRKTEADLKEFPILQLEILKNAGQYLKAGGSMVYSTCTICTQENQGVVESFLRESPDFERVYIKHPLTGEEVPEISLYPHLHGVDGFYIVKLKKK